MAIVKYKVTDITKEFDGNTCEFKADVVSTHKVFKWLFPSDVLFSAEKEVKIGYEFQNNGFNLISKV